MKKSMRKTLSIIALTVGLTGVLTGCKPYNKPEFVTIQPSQTAFLVPLVGDVKEQGSFASEDLLAKTKVATKEIQIPKHWVQTGRSIPVIGEVGEYRKSATLIIVERKPETREWTNSATDGTTAKNEGIKAETKESIAFTAKMSATAQIDEQNAVKFLYRYNSSSLATIMDTEIRTRIQTIFVEQTAKYNLADLLVNKDTIMKTVRDSVIPYFAERGITITQIGLKGDFDYDNKEIQTAIDNTFKTKKALEAQQSENERVLSKAKADAEAIREQASTIQESIKLKELDNQKALIDKWNGTLPTIQGTGNSIIQLPSTATTK